MSDLIYGLPTSVLGVLIVGLSVALPCLGFAIMHRLVPTEIRRTQNDVAGYISNIAAFVYAVLIAFLAVGVWQDFGKAKVTAQLEANAASNVFRQAEGYPEPLRTRVRTGIRQYVEMVIHTEWPQQAKGRASDDAWQVIEPLHREMLTYQPPNPREQIVHLDQLRDMDRLLDERRNRISAASSGLHPVVWVVILNGSVLIVAFCFFMGTPNHRAHLAMTALLGASIGLVLFLIVALDRPFRGGVGIGPDAFMTIRDNIRRLDTK